MDFFRLIKLLIVSLTLMFTLSPNARAEDPNDPDEETVCQLEGGVAPIVSLAWLEQPPAGTAGHLKRNILTLVAQNHSDEPQLARVTLNRYGNQTHRPFKPRWLWLHPGDSRQVPLNLRALGFDLRTLETSASLRAHVEVLEYRQAAGRAHLATRGQSLGPKLYFHGETNPGNRRTHAVVYDNEAKRVLFNAGDVSGERLDDLREALALFRQRDDFPFATAAIMDTNGGARHPDDVVLGLPGSGNHTFCVRIPFDSEDSGIGEDFFTGAGTQWLPASYTRVSITNFNFGNDSVVLKNGRLDADGCISFNHAANSDIWSVLIITQADVPRSDQPADTNRFFALDQGGNVSTWYFHGELESDGEVKYFNLDGDDRANIFIAGVQSLARFSDGLADEILYAMDDACPSAPNNSCNGSFTTFDFQEIPVAYIHPDHNAHKFAISHEMGHAVVHRFFGDIHPVLFSMYNINTGGPECIFDDGAHALHSEERSSSALTEGFAQFYATAVWNDTSEQDAMFHYYKDNYKDGSVQDVDMADGPLGGVDAYLRNVCAGDDASKAGHGVELDWARQFWDYRTRPGNAPSNLEIMEQYRLAVNAPSLAGWNNSNSWQRMMQGISDFDTNNGSNFLPRWNVTDNQNGIDF